MTGKTGTAKTATKTAAAPAPGANETTAAKTTAQSSTPEPGQTPDPQTVSTTATTPGGEQQPDGGDVINPNPQPVITDDRVRVTPEYLSALENYTTLGLGMPAPTLTAEDIRNATQDETDRRNKLEEEKKQSQELEIELSKTKKSELENKQFIMLTRETATGTEDKRFTRVAWEQMSGNRDGWRPKAEEPEEVKNLKK